MAALPEFRVFINELADMAGEIIRPLFRSYLGVDSKQDQSPVTLADRNAENAMREAIMQRYPDHGIWGEEFGQHNMGAKYCWVLDPVDGTKSFISGFPTFGTLISLTRMGVPVLGLIDQPIARERWIGEAGSTVLLQPSPSLPLPLKVEGMHGTLESPSPFRERAGGEDENKKRNLATSYCKTRGCASLAEATFSTTSPSLFGEYQALHDKLREAARFTIYGYDSYAYAQLASGHIDLVVEAGLKPHDFCALRSVVENAGGIITDWQGKPLTLASDGKVIAAGDKRVHEEILRLLKGHAA